MNRDTCPICKTPAEIGHPTGDALQVRCPRCGPFIVSGSVLAMLPNRLDADPRASARISHAIRSLTSEDRWLKIDSTLLDELAARRLPGAERQIANLLAWLKVRAGEAPFSTVNIGNRDAMAAIIGSVDDASFQHILDWGIEDGLLEISDAGRQVRMTPKALMEHPKPARAPTTEKLQEKPGTIKGHCPNCGPDRTAHVVASHREHWDDDDSPVWGIDEYRLLKCGGCEAVYLRHDNLFSENEDFRIDPITGEHEPYIPPTITYWPAPARRIRPVWLDELKDHALRNLLDEVYGALDSDRRVLAAIGTRTALDRAMVLKGADAGSSFRAKLQQLQEAGTIAHDERAILETLTDAGSAAAHRGWRPTPQMLATIMDGTEAFLHRALVLGDAVAAIKGDVPPRPARVPTDKPCTSRGG
jgi:Domain of unknown function (DUF4145)